GGEGRGGGGRPADVYLVATLATGLLSGGRPNDTVSMGPAVTAVLEEATAELPALRPATASAFATQLRRALVRDTAVGGWDFQSSAYSDIGLGGRSNHEAAWAPWRRGGGGVGWRGGLSRRVRGR